MSKVLFLSMPSHGNVNPTLGLVNELTKQGEEVIYFSSETFKEKIEQAGAIFKSYNEDLDIFKMEDEGPVDPLFKVIASADLIIEDILQQVEDVKFDYLIHSMAFPFTKIIAQISGVPAVSSLAVFSGLKEFFCEDHKAEHALAGMEPLMKTYADVSCRINKKYNYKMPDNMIHLLFNKSKLNFVYTSEYFISPEDKAFFDDTYKFVGPPIYTRKENLDFPFERLKDTKVIFISLGTVFGNYKPELYNIFFEAFAGSEATVVLAAHKVDLSNYAIPKNFIVRDYVPQSAILQHTDVAITHGGMNSISDLIYYHIPFVAIPLGADQPVLAKRTEELGAAIALDAKTLTSKDLKIAVDKVMNDPSYLENINRIRQSFTEAGGYPKAVEEIFKLKKEKDILN